MHMEADVCNMSFITNVHAMMIFIGLRSDSIFGFCISFHCTDRRYEDILNAIKNYKKIRKPKQKI